MKKIVLLLVSIPLLLVSCSSTPDTASPQEQEQVDQAFEQVYQHFERGLIVDNRYFGYFGYSLIVDGGTM